MDTPTYFLLNPLKPATFVLTKKAREQLGPRFARHGIAVAQLATADDWDEAIAAVIWAEYQALSAIEREDRVRLDAIFDLQFVTDPLYGIPPTSLIARRAVRHETIQTVLYRGGLGSSLPQSSPVTPDLRGVRVRFHRVLRATLTPPLIQHVIAQVPVSPNILSLAGCQRWLAQLIAKLRRFLANLCIGQRAEQHFKRRLIKRWRGLCLCGVWLLTNTRPRSLGG